MDNAIIEEEDELVGEEVKGDMAMWDFNDIMCFLVCSFFWFLSQWLILSNWISGLLHLFYQPLCLCLRLFVMIFMFVPEFFSFKLI